MRSAISYISLVSCVLSNTLTLFNFLRLFTHFHILRLTTGSTPADISSNNRICGCDAIALQSARRLSIPPESLDAFLVTTS